VSTRIMIKVTEADIERAHRNDSYTCVVAQAIARAVPDATRIEVDSQAIRFTTEGQRRLYLTPYAVQGYVIAFDAGDPIEPFQFQLRDPRRLRRNLKTPEGAAANNAATRARRAAGKEASTARVEAPVAAPREAAKAAYAEARRSAPSATVARSDRGGRKAPPRVFKKKRRAYGHRLLRINQDAE
jgi:hypothetical protein